MFITVTPHCGNKLIRGDWSCGLPKLIVLRVHMVCCSVSNSSSSVVSLPDAEPCVRHSQTVQRTVLCMGRKQEAVENVPVGNTVRCKQYTPCQITSGFLLMSLFRWSRR